MTAQAGSASFLMSRSLSDRYALRCEMRSRRRALPAAVRRQATQRFASVASRLRLLRPRQKLALYLPQGSEADPHGLLQLAQRLRCAVFLPVIADYRTNTMRFVRFAPGDALRANRYGILEPTNRDGIIRVRELDLVVLPLLAADEFGARLGSGAGYYDRALRHLRTQRRWRRPKLIGLGYEFQRVPYLDSQPWDVPLDAVLTENGFYPRRTRSV